MKLLAFLLCLLIIHVGGFKRPAARRQMTGACDAVRAKCKATDDERQCSAAELLCAQQLQEHEAFVLEKFFSQVGRSEVTKYRANGKTTIWQMAILPSNGETT